MVYVVKNQTSLDVGGLKATLRKATPRPCLVQGQAPKLQPISRTLSFHPNWICATCFFSSLHCGRCSLLIDMEHPNSREVRAFHSLPRMIRAAIHIIWKMSTWHDTQRFVGLCNLSWWMVGPEESPEPRQTRSYKQFWVSWLRSCQFLPLTKQLLLSPQVISHSFFIWRLNDSRDEEWLHSWLDNIIIKKHTGTFSERKKNFEGQMRWNFFSTI